MRVKLKAALAAIPIAAIAALSLAAPALAHNGDTSANCASGKPTGHAHFDSYSGATVKVYVDGNKVVDSTFNSNFNEDRDLGSPFTGHDYRVKIVASDNHQFDFDKTRHVDACQTPPTTTTTAPPTTTTQPATTTTAAPTTTICTDTTTPGSPCYVPPTTVAATSPTAPPTTICTDTATPGSPCYVPPPLTTAAPILTVPPPTSPLPATGSKPLGFALLAVGLTITGIGAVKLARRPRRG